MIVSESAFAVEAVLFGSDSLAVDRGKEKVPLLSILSQATYRACSTMGEPVYK